MGFVVLLVVVLLVVFKLWAMLLLLLLAEAEADAYLAEIEARMGLPAVDTYRHGAGRLVDALAAL